MPLDVQGCTRATMRGTTSLEPSPVGAGNLVNSSLALGIESCNRFLERGISCKRKSPTCVEYVPTLCTHRPTLLLIEYSSEALGLGLLLEVHGKLVKLDHSIVVKDVTRFP